MKIIFIGIAVVLMFFIIFIFLGIAVSKRNMKKNKYDLLDYLEQNKDKLSITLKENGQDTILLNSEKEFPLASTLKIIIAFTFVKSVTNNKISITNIVELNKVDIFYIPNTDGGAHPNWKKSLNSSSEASLLEIAKGMMQFSSNACTDYLINEIGVDVINQSIEALKLNHDKITYLTPPILIPGYLSDKRSVAINKLEQMDKQSYQELSQELFEKMKANETAGLERIASKMLNQKMQLLLTNKTTSSTTKQYADLMFRLGKELLTQKEKELFSEILIGENSKDDYFWFKGGSTIFVLTSALYKETKNNTVAVSLFIKDDTGGELYWIRNIFSDFVKSIATDLEFREKVKKMTN